MRVKATRLGFYGNMRRRPGDIFDIKDDIEIKTKDKKKKTISEFSEKWMKQIDADKVGKKEKKASKREPVALSKGANAALHTGDLNDIDRENDGDVI